MSRKVTVCARWDEQQMEGWLEWRLYHQIMGAFKIDRFAMTPIDPQQLRNTNIDQYDTLEEALATCEGTKIFLEATGEGNIGDIPDGDITLVLGASGKDNLHLIDRNSGDLVVAINAPLTTSLYATNVVAIVAATLYGQ